MSSITIAMGTATSALITATVTSITTVLMIALSYWERGISPGKK